MPTPTNTILYNQVKREADQKYSKPSAYKSGWIVKTYKQRGGEYSGEKTKAGLTRWYAEQWADVGGKAYPVYRPTKRVDKNTPLLASEISPTNLREQIAIKQRIRGNKNLPPFVAK
jgi:hypothetical protein